MGDFEGKRWRPYLDKEAQDRRDEILDHLKRKYDGPSDFLKQKLKEEQSLDLDERIQKLESEMNEKKKDLERLKQIKTERQQQDKLRDKKELLKEKQKKLRKLQRQDTMSEEEIRQEVREEERERVEKRANHPKVDKSVEELMETDRIQRRIEKFVSDRLEDKADIDEVVEDVERLQEQIAELNGGEESWFMDLKQEKQEVEA